ncbi:MAG: DUF5602 domain-containing protein [Gemmatimonadaceae bacterium]|nr:DUF5602 domain-containing protein [Gemmatimonadaceae bacterium]
MSGSAVLLASCTDSSAIAPTGDAAFARAGYDTPGVNRQYGTPLSLGKGKARAYVVTDTKDGKTPLEIGIAFDETVLDGLGTDMQMLHLPFPGKAPAPYTFMMLDWNPQGHEPPHVYDEPHFDFHFYTVPEAEVMSIAPWVGPPPAAAFIPPQNAPAGYFSGPPVPMMGTHWLCGCAPELARFNNPAWALLPKFDKTFIYGSWNGRWTFLEPMITREYLLSLKTAVIGSFEQVVPPVPNAAAPGNFGKAGWYPARYRIVYDAQAKEYRIALATLSWAQ